MPSTNPRLFEALDTTTNRRTFLRGAGLGVAGLLGLGSLAACSSSSSGTPQSSGTGGKPDYGKIALQLPWIKNIQFAGEYFADSKGYYKAAGFSSVQLLAGGAASTSPEALVLSNKVLIGNTSPITTAAAIAQQNAPLKIIGAEFQKAPFCIVSIADKTPIRTLADLKGKKIGIQTGTNEAIWKGFLKINNIDPSELTQVPVQYDPTPVTTGAVDGFMAYVTNEPVLLEGEGFKPVTLTFADNGMPLFTDCLIVTEDTLTKQRDLLKAFLKAQIRGWRDAVANPSGAARLAVNVYGKDQKLQVGEQTKEAVIQNTLVSTPDTTEHGLLTISDTLLHQTVDSLGAMGTKVTASQLVDTSLIREVIEQNPELVGS